MVTFVSRLYTGHSGGASAKFIVAHVGFIDLLDSRTVMTDRGFDIQSSLSHCVTLSPLTSLRWCPLPVYSKRSWGYKPNSYCPCAQGAYKFLIEVFSYTATYPANIACSRGSSSNRVCLCDKPFDPLAADEEYSQWSNTIYSASTMLDVSHHCKKCV